MAFGVALSTVLVPAASQALTDVATFKEELGLSGSRDDAYIKRLVAQASAAAASYCNRTFVVETVLDEVWPGRDSCPSLVPGGLGRLQLARWPIVAVESVLENGVPLADGTDFRADAAAGQLVRLAGGYPGPWPSLPLAVTYRAGFDPIPDDLVDVVLRMMRARWFARRRDPAMRSESVSGDWNASYWFGAGAAGGMPPDIAELLDFYCVPIVG